jgi:hypothetical protein
MKALLLVVVVCVVLFLAGLIAPRKSRALQQRFSRLMNRGERKSARKGGRVGKATRKSLKWSRRAGEKSARAGRDTRRELPF